MYFNPHFVVLNKPRNTSRPHTNRPKVPTGSSMKLSASDESSLRINLKHLFVKSLSLGMTSKRMIQFSGLGGVCLIHKTISMKNLRELIEEVDHELLSSNKSYGGCLSNSTSESREMEEFIDSLANVMWMDYVDDLSEISQIKVFQALSADPNSARAFLDCLVVHRELWLKVKFDNEFLE
ncbi:hypothetical protein Cgig2_021330 [Carnegiea gigantea]|uniref:Uncharacterized protein n=1 Tax=Carnegiea gigantea TaxID=171969 RepID=A0A9Q1Q5C6_9CARY|nr:hypothetical protein Cgig2_021330 [Carnegiea gigantea]